MLEVSGELSLAPHFVCSLRTAVKETESKTRRAVYETPAEVSVQEAHLVSKMYVREWICNENHNGDEVIPRTTADGHPFLPFNGGGMHVSAADADLCALCEAETWACDDTYKVMPTVDD